MVKNKNVMASALVTLTLVSLLLSSCAPQPTTVHTSTPTRLPGVTPTATPEHMPVITFKPGDFYFNVDGDPKFVFSRNIAASATNLSDYDRMLEMANAGSTRLIRFQIDSMGGMGYTNTGEIDETWAGKWDQVFDKAQAENSYILIVFSGWFDWNDGEGFSSWASNPLNAANGGPAEEPGELL